MSTGDDVETGFTPETVSPEERESVFCFLSEDRLCLPTCVAYCTNPAETRSPELSPAQQRCTLLHNAERASRHLVIIASLLSASEKRKKTEAIDRKREQQITQTLVPTNPFGSNKS